MSDLTLRDRVLAARQPAGTRCQVAEVLEVLSAEDAAALREMLADPHVRGSWIYRGLREQGVECSDQSITRHRAKRCKCP